MLRKQLEKEMWSYNSICYTGGKLQMFSNRGSSGCKKDYHPFHSVNGSNEIDTSLVNIRT